MSINDKYLKISLAYPDQTNDQSSHSLIKPNEIHLTGDLLASAEDSLRFAPDFSLEDPSIHIRKPSFVKAANTHQTYSDQPLNQEESKLTPSTTSQKMAS